PPEPATELQLPLELPLREDVDGVSRELLDGGHDARFRSPAAARFSMRTDSSSSAGSNPNTWPRNESSASCARRCDSAFRNPCPSPSKVRYAYGVPRRLNASTIASA